MAMANVAPSALASFEAEVLGRDTRRRVTNTRAAPFRYICHIGMPGGLTLGTGTLVGPASVLTAAHVVHGVHPSRVVVTPARNGASRPFGWSRATSYVHWFPGFVASDEGTVRDLVLVRLASQVGRRAGWWTARATRDANDDVGRSISGRALPQAAGLLRVNLSGYPRDKCGTPPSPVNCGTTAWRTYDGTVRLRSGLLHYLNDTKVGHSGSPVWVRRHPSIGGRVLVAVHLRGGSRANAAVKLTPAMVEWIAANRR
jgi:glutamyl endopeptidase